MVSDDTLNEFRLDGVLVRVVRDACEENDVEGMVVAWSDTHVLIRKKNRKVVRLSREYLYQPAHEERKWPG
mgnify:FL=1